MSCTLSQATAYDHVLMEAMHYPDVWYEYATWHVEGGGGGSAPALAVLHRGRRVRCGGSAVPNPDPESPPRSQTSYVIPSCKPLLVSWADIARKVLREQLNLPTHNCQITSSLKLPSRATAVLERAISSNARACLCHPAVPRGVVKSWPISNPDPKRTSSKSNFVPNPHLDPDDIASTCCRRCRRRCCCTSRRQTLRRPRATPPRPSRSMRTS